jgi:hypothetical protein
MAFDYSSVANEIKEYWYTRKTTLLKYWDFYQGDNQRYYLDRFEGESEQEYNTRVLGATIENHCAKTCDVLVSYLYGQPESTSRVTVRVVDKDGKIIEDLQRVLHQIWEHNEIDALRIDVGLMASVTGLAVVYKEFVDSRTGRPFPKTAPVADKAKYGVVEYQLFDTVDTMPLPAVDDQNVVRSRKLGAIVRFYESDNFTGISTLDRLLQKRFASEEWLEVYDSKSFMRSRIVSGKAEPEIVSQQTNPYGDVNIPFTVFRNYGDPMFIEGQSDLAQMISLQNTLNAVVNDDKMVIDYHSFPILVLMGGAKLPPNFVRKVNSVLEADVNQDMKYLTWDNVLEATDVFKESLRKQMTVTSGVGQMSRGNAEDIGQVRSGAGLKTLFQADINTIALKVPHFKKSEKELAASTLRMYAAQVGMELPYFEIQVEFPADFVGVDKLLQAQVEELEISNATRSPRDIVKAKYADLKSEGDVDRIIEEAVDHLEDVAEAKKPPDPQIKPGETSDQKSMEQQESE